VSLERRKLARNPQMAQDDTGFRRVPIRAGRDARIQLQREQPAGVRIFDVAALEDPVLIKWNLHHHESNR